MIKYFFFIFICELNMFAEISILRHIKIIKSFAQKSNITFFNTFSHIFLNLRYSNSKTIKKIFKRKKFKDCLSLLNVLPSLMGKNLYSMTVFFFFFFEFNSFTNLHRLYFLISC